VRDPVTPWPAVRAACNRVSWLRYNEAKQLAESLEQQAHKVQAEAEEAGARAVETLAVLTGVPPLDTAALEVSRRTAELPRCAAASS